MLFLFLYTDKNADKRDIKSSDLKFENLIKEGNFLTVKILYIQVFITILYKIEPRRKKIAMKTS